MSKLKVYVGQGTQYKGMYKKILSDNPDINKGINKIYSVGEDITQLPLRELSDNGPEEKQKDTAIQQPLILAGTAALGYSTGDAIRIEGDEYLGYQENIDPTDVRIGFSFGELYALVAAGKIPLTSAFKIALQRGRLMRDAGQGTMLLAVVGPDEIDYNKEKMTFDDYLSRAAQEAGLDIDFSIFNSPGNRTVGGKVEEVREFQKILESQGLIKKIVAPSVPGAFHTKYFHEAGEKLQQFIMSEGGIFYPLWQDVIANSDARPYDNSREGTSRKLGRHISIPVQFEGSVQREIRKKRFEWIEAVGPKAKVLCKGIQKTVKKGADEFVDFNHNLEVKVIDTWKAARKYIDEQKELKKLRPGYGLGFSPA